LEIDGTRRAFARIRYLGLGFSYLHLGFTFTADEEAWLTEEIETVVKGVFRTHTAEDRFDTWIDAFSDIWGFDNKE